MREFDGSLEIELFAATAAGLLVFVLVIGGLILLIRALLRRVSPGRAEQQ
jgi:hypothetical protein